MTDVLAPLTTEESALLQIMAQGGSVADLGEHSRWSVPLQGLVARGYVARLDQHNHVITTTGKVVAVSSEDEDVRALIGVNNALVEQRQSEEAVMATLRMAIEGMARTVKASLPRERWRAAEHFVEDAFAREMAKP